MNWWQTPYSPPPPYGWPPQSQIPCPPGVDPIKVMEFMDRVQRRAQKAKEKDKKPEDKKKETGKIVLWYFQAACILYFLSPFIAAMQHIIESFASTLIK